MRQDAHIYLLNDLWLTDKPLGKWQPHVRERLRRDYREVFKNPRFRVYVRSGTCAGAVPCP
jgi:hypothetical protein